MRVASLSTAIEPMAPDMGFTEYSIFCALLLHIVNSMKMIVDNILLIFIYINVYIHSAFVPVSRLIRLQVFDLR